MSTTSGRLGVATPRHRFAFLLLAVFLVVFPLSAAFAQHCNSNWTAAYRCMQGCGGCPATNNPNSNYDYAAAQRAQAAAAEAAAQQQREAELQQQRIEADNQRRIEEARKQAQFIDDRDHTQLRGSSGLARDSGLRGSSAEPELRGLKDAVADSPSDEGSADGSVGYRIAKPKLKPAVARKPGTNTKAGDQLLSAAAAGENLSPNYEGGAGYAGSLKRPAVDVRGGSINPATFTEREKNAPGMHEALKRLDTLQARRSQMQEELKRATAQRNTQTDAAKMAELTAKVDQQNKAYQANLKAIHDEEATVRKIKMHVDTQ